MPQAACLTPLPLLSPLDCTVFCSKQSFTVWAAQVNLPGWLGRGDAAHSTAALAALTCWGGSLSTGFVPWQGMQEGCRAEGGDGERSGGIRSQGFGEPRVSCWMRRERIQI